MKIKLLLLSDPGSIHTIRWANSLSEKGIEILVFGFGNYRVKDYLKEIHVISEGRRSQGMLSKLTYPLSMIRLGKIIHQFCPDIVHAHYASSYGLLGRLSRFKPFLISVWGSDIFEFPNFSIFHKQILKSNLQAAVEILSTSHVMERETRKILLNENPIIKIIPFGIDLKQFIKKNRHIRNEIVIGTVKTLTFNYGIDILIEAFFIISTKHPTIDLRLSLAGEGADKKHFVDLVKKYQIQDKVKFLGKIDHINVPEVLNDFDIFVALSNNESFGVSVIEASACGLPVIVTNVGGLPEVVEDQITGLIVDKGDAQMAASAMEELVLNPVKRAAMGRAGRTRVERCYDWESNVNSMVDVYQTLLKSFPPRR